MTRPLALPLALLLALLALAPAAFAEETATKAPARDDIFPLDKVRPGMRGEAVTVVAGTKMTRFEVEVIDVVRNYIAKQDVILVRCLGDEIARMGIAQGMSGSPVRIDGRIVGAMAYTWGWAKEPLCGVTPIEAMLEDAVRPLEGRPTGAWPETPLRQRPPVPLAEGATGLTPIRAPLSISGFTAEGRRALVEALRPLGFGDVHAIGGEVVSGAPNAWANLDAPVEPGCALVVDLVRGDMNASAIGTCTYVDGDRIIGFGHPFQSLGETLLPLSVGYVYMVMPSRNISFKLGSSIRDIGALVQDRESGITGIKGAKAPMVPVDVTVKNAVTQRKEDFHIEVTANRLYFTRMIFIALRDLILRAEGTLGVNTKRYTISVKLKGVEKPWTYQDEMVGFDTGLSRVLMGLVDRVENHPTQRASFEWIKLDVSIENKDSRVQIEAVTPAKEDVRPGEETDLLLRMRRREGGEIFYERLTVAIPEDAPAGGLQIQVLGGDMVAAEIASPRDIDDIGDLYDAFYKSTELVAVVPTGRVNLDMDGRLIKSLPLSLLPRLVRSTDSVGARIQPVTKKIRRSVPYIVAGRGAVQLNVVR